MEHRVFAPPNPAVIPADRTHPLYRFDDEAAQSPDTLALFTAAGEGDLGALRAVLARGVDVNATDYGWTALAWAVAEVQLPAVSELLRAGADPNAGNIKADPLCCAVFRGRKDIILALLRAGASLEGERYDFLDSDDIVAFLPMWLEHHPKTRPGGSHEWREYCPEDLAFEYVMRVRQAGGFLAYRERRYSECVGAHLVARERGLPAEMVHVVLDMLLRQGDVTVTVRNHFAPDLTVLRCHEFLVQPWEKLSKVFRWHGRGANLCYRLPGSDVSLASNSTVRSLGAAIRAAETSESFAVVVVVEAHDALHTSPRSLS